MSALTRQYEDGTVCAGIIQQWKSNPAIRAEFGKIGTFAAYEVARHAGCIKPIGQRQGGDASSV